MGEKDSVNLSSFDRGLITFNTAAATASAIAARNLAKQTEALLAVQSQILNEKIAEKDASETVDRIFRKVEAMRSEHFASREYRAYLAAPYLAAIRNVNTVHLIEPVSKDRKQGSERQLNEWMSSADPNALKELRWALKEGLDQWERITNKAGLHRVLAEGINGEFFPEVFGQTAIQYAIMAGIGCVCYYFIAISPVEDEFSAWILPAVVFVVPTVIWRLRARPKRLPAEWAAAKEKVEKITGNVVGYCSGDLEDPAKLEIQANEITKRINNVFETLIGSRDRLVLRPVERSETERLAMLKERARAHGHMEGKGTISGVLAAIFLVAAGFFIRPRYLDVLANPVRYTRAGQEIFAAWDRKTRFLGLFNVAEKLEADREQYLSQCIDSLKLGVPYQDAGFTRLDHRGRIERLVALIETVGPGRVKGASQAVAQLKAQLAQWPDSDYGTAVTEVWKVAGQAQGVASSLHPYMSTDDLAAVVLDLRRQEILLLERACIARGMSPYIISSAKRGGEFGLLRALELGRSADRERTGTQRKSPKT